MGMTPYRKLIASKQWKAPADGFFPSFMPDALFPFQRAAVAWACRKGRAALFEDCGLGKTIQQLTWAENVRTAKGNVLILAPLAVADQTVREGERFGIAVTRVHEPSDVVDGICITNYDRAERFLAMPWSGIVLDESSILKAHDGATRNAIIEGSRSIPYRLACTATPSPNDHTELGNHAEFLGIMSRTEMLASFFVHDGGETSIWRLKGHADADFWKWVAGWGIMMRKPSDLGFDDDGFALPELRIIPHILDSGLVEDGNIFAMPARTLEEQRRAKRKTLDQRCQAVAELIAREPDHQWLVWCELNDEGDRLTEIIPGAVQVAGADSDDNKAERMMGFTDGSVRVMVSKGKIAGFGMNWQNCCRMAFVGPSHSYEMFYQSVRRCWRFGQRNPVHVHVMSTDVESEILANVQRKQADADRMAEGMVIHMADITKQDITGTSRQSDDYKSGTYASERFTAHLGDCVEGVSRLVTDSIHYTIFSPPFASLYTYSNSPFDMGNCKDHGEFFEQFKCLIPELLRVTMPGRLLSFHCMDMPTSKDRDGFIGLRDFSGDLTRAFTDAGWIFHSKCTIWKDPVTAMQRTKALGLLHKTIRKDSAMSRQGIADYLVTMRKPGLNPERVYHYRDEDECRESCESKGLDYETEKGKIFPVGLWQNYASPVWMDINPSDTLQKESAREHNDERHICPLQLEVIRRALHLWTNPGDLVLSPFMGIGSEGVSSLRMGRRFVGYELKQSYLTQAVENLRNAEQTFCGQQTIFSAGAA
jgi:superfamily II DNA or RNA helicase